MSLKNAAWTAAIAVAVVIGYDRWQKNGKLI